MQYEELEGFRRPLDEWQPRGRSQGAQREKTKKPTSKYYGGSLARPVWRAVDARQTEAYSTNNRTPGADTCFA